MCSHPSHYWISHRDILVTLLSLVSTVLGQTDREFERGGEGLGSRGRCLFRELCHREAAVGGEPSGDLRS